MTESPLADLNTKAADHLTGTTLTRWKIEAKRLVREMGAEQARPILNKWIDLWSRKVC